MCDDRSVQYFICHDLFLPLESESRQLPEIARNTHLVLGVRVAQATGRVTQTGRVGTSEPFILPCYSR